MNDRLPEMLWAVLIRSLGDQPQAIAELRRILDWVYKHPNREAVADLTLTGIASWDEAHREDFLQHVCSSTSSAAALATLRLFDQLPARDSWDKVLPEITPDVNLLMSGVGSALWHQSDNATDCRWVRLMGQLLAGKLYVPNETFEELAGYPDVGKLEKVRPTIRASEIMIGPEEDADHSWSQSFWDEAWRHTPCLDLTAEATFTPVDCGVTRETVAKAVGELTDHWAATHHTTAIDARHDAVFGIAFYGLRLLDELLGISLTTSALGRLALRTILELHLSLRFLLTKDESVLWKRWREYGAGQAKLNALRLDDPDVEPPTHIDVGTINHIAGEDVWEEYLTVQLGSWSGLDLRKLSDKAGEKDTYDRHYSWTSGYVHGTWGPIRESCFKTCGNPLHRLHRYPDLNVLPDILLDAADLIDAILASVDEAYTTFGFRFGKPTP